MRMKRDLGQHMVISRNLLRRIVEYAEVNDSDVVLEVGCGTGNLTHFLLERAKIVVGIEKDPELVNFLKKRFSVEIEDGKFQLIEGDALKVEFPHFTKFVSNIPFKISSPLTFKLLEYRFDLAVVMYQKEFAERLCGEDSRIGVISKAYCRAKILETVRPSVFRPSPSVESAVVRIIPEPEIRVKNLELFRDFVTFAFTMRRKKMKKIVEKWNRRRNIKVQIDDEILEKRPEEIGARTFAQIVDSLSETGTEKKTGSGG
jgi:16S rRNA (adenine1518-N6/adenine1519-N6)-dimethyltransferase